MVTSILEEEKEIQFVHEDEQSFIIFQLNNQYLAMRVDLIVQIIPMVTINPLPESNPVIEGLINVRGESIVVINLRRRLGFQEVKSGLHTPILLVQFEQHTVGLIVDDVVDVMRFPETDIVPSNVILPEGLGEIAVLKGVIQDEIGTILLININRLFITENQGVLDQNMPTLPESQENGSSGVPAKVETEMIEAVSSNGDLDGPSAKEEVKIENGKKSKGPAKAKKRSRKTKKSTKRKKDKK